MSNQLNPTALAKPNAPRAVLYTFLERRIRDMMQILGEQSRKMTSHDSFAIRELLREILDERAAMRNEMAQQDLRISQLEANIGERS